MHILEREGEQYFTKGINQEYFDAICSRPHTFKNNCLFDLGAIKFNEPSTLKKKLRESLKVEYFRQKRLLAFHDQNFKKKA